METDPLSSASMCSISMGLAEDGPAMSQSQLQSSHGVSKERMALKRPVANKWCFGSVRRLSGFVQRNANSNVQDPCKRQCFRTAAAEQAGVPDLGS